MLVSDQSVAFQCDFLLERLTGYKGKDKGKFHPITVHEVPEVEQDV